MAIDNAAKRRCVASTGVTGLMAPGVTPSLTQNADWRNQSAWGYSGIPVTVVVIYVPRIRSGSTKVKTSFVEKKIGTRFIGRDIKTTF